MAPDEGPLKKKSSASRMEPWG